jgi:hypothetical protein
MTQTKSFQRLFSFHFADSSIPFSPQSAIRLNENVTKINQLKDDQEECETRLEKERDVYASNMFDLLAEEDNISSYILNYVKCKTSPGTSDFQATHKTFLAFSSPSDQQLYYKSALKEIESLMGDMNSLISKSIKMLVKSLAAKNGGAQA